MKKSLVIALAMVFVLGIAGTALAANPFVDVPANHWAYKYVNDLAKDGIVDGFGDGSYKGDQVMSRYQMAVIVGKAMAKVDKMDGKISKENSDKLAKLQAEFRDELDKLGVKVDELSAKVDNMPKFSGNVRFRYDNHQYTPTTGDKYSASSFKERTRISFVGKINDDWTYNGRFQNIQDLQSQYDGDKAVRNDQNTSYNLGWIQGKVGNGTVKLGRFDYFPTYGLTADSSMKGFAYSQSGPVSFDIWYGKPDVDSYFSAANTNDKTIYTGVDFGTSFNGINFKAGYNQYKCKDVNVVNGSKDKWSNWEAGFDTKLGGDFGFTAAYSKSNADNDSKVYMGQVSYKGIDTKTPGTWGADLTYARMESNSTWDTTLNFTNGYKGYQLAFHYVPMKNSQLDIYYLDQKQVNNTDAKDKLFRTDLIIYF